MNKLRSSSITSLNYVLIAGLVLSIILIGYGVYLAQSKLTERVVEVDHLRIDADSNDKNINYAKQLEQILTQHEQDIKRAESVVADTKYYSYQDQVVKDLNAYAVSAGVTILGFNFSQPTTQKKSPASSTAPSSQKTMLATVTLKNPMSYESFIRFLRLIENNLTKMQVTQLDAQLANQGAPGSVLVPVINLEVFVQ